MTDTPTTNWFDGYDDETKGYLQARGLDKMTAEEAVKQTIQAHRNAESKLGIPADKVLRMPEPEDKDGWTSLYTRLGVPTDPSAYDFSGVKDEALATFLRATASETKLTKAAAETIAQKFVAFRESIDNQATMQKQTSVAAQRLALEQSWGANKETYNFIATRAGDMLGLTIEELNALANASGYDKVMNGLLKMGTAMGEQKLLGIGDNHAGGSNTIMSREQALDKLASLKTDEDFKTRWFRGDKDCIDLLSNLNRIAVGQKPTA